MKMKKKSQNYVDVPQNLTTENYSIWTSSNTMTWELVRNVKSWTPHTSKVNFFFFFQNLVLEVSHREFGKKQNNNTSSSVF